MTARIDTDAVTLVEADCLALLRSLPDASIDAVVSDPPYELGFMGKAWDASGIAYSVELWREVLRVLKPGGHLLAFGATRTYHRMTVAIEDAGFEIRDSLHWLYATGFPKSLDVSKAIDKRRQDDPRPVCRFIRAAMDARGVSSKQVAEHFGFHSRMVDHWAARDTDSQPTVPTVEQYEQLRSMLGFGPELDAEMYRLNGRKGTLGENFKRREVLETRVDGGTRTVNILSGISGEYHVTAPATDIAKRWRGWGTALKPAHEPIVMARKRLAGTVAENVQAFGTGAINVDGSRIGEEVLEARARARGVTVMGTFQRAEGKVTARDPGASGLDPNVGRWPANVLLDEAAAESVNGAPWFFVAKPSRRERDFGCDALPVRDAAVTVERDPDSAGAANPRAGAGRNGGARNFHPTVKPVALMRHLVRLVAPPGGVVLDPFTGSGTTGIAAVREGFCFLGIERDPAYCEIAAARIGAALREAGEGAADAGAGR